MQCVEAENCGGCIWRNLSQEDYQQQKICNFQKIIAPLGDINYGTPIFISDATRRRASLTFRYRKKQLILGFNRSRSDEVVNVQTCPLLTPRLNAVLPEIRKLLEALCAIPYATKKGKKLISETINSGDVLICEAENGIDVVLEYDAPLELNHRMELFEQVNQMTEIIRLSHRRDVGQTAEPIIEKSKPYVKISQTAVYIPAGTFLQPSKEGQEALIGLALKYLGNTTGKIADLFCGVGTFSYALAENKENKIFASDSSADLLKGFQDSLNANQIPNVEIATRNLFKYPLDTNELLGFDAVVLDPPRAGAAAQVKQLAALSEEKRPEKIIMVSCNPHSFVKDALELVSAGYTLRELTMVDQFVYSNHSELVALFTKDKS